MFTQGAGAAAERPRARRRRARSAARSIPKASSSTRRPATSWSPTSTARRCIEFNRSGQLVRGFDDAREPAAAQQRHRRLNYAADAGNTPGKRTNRGFEGLAISPDGRYVYAMLQSAMLDEGGGDGVYHTASSSSTPRPAQAVGAVRLPDGRRRPGPRHLGAGGAGNDTSSWCSSATTAASASAPSWRRRRQEGLRDRPGRRDRRHASIELPPAGDLPPAAGRRPRARHGACDLGADTLAALGGVSPEKWEGLAIGPRLADGSYLVLAGTDNDYRVTQNASGAQFDVYFKRGPARREPHPVRHRHLRELHRRECRRHAGRRAAPRFDFERLRADPGRAARLCATRDSPATLAPAFRSPRPTR